MINRYADKKVHCSTLVKLVMIPLTEMSGLVVIVQRPSEPSILIHAVLHHVSVIAHIELLLGPTDKFSFAQCTPVFPHKTKMGSESMPLRGHCRLYVYNKRTQPCTYAVHHCCTASLMP